MSLPNCAMSVPHYMWTFTPCTVLFVLFINGELTFDIYLLTWSLKIKLVNKLTFLINWNQNVLICKHWINKEMKLTLILSGEDSLSENNPFINPVCLMTYNRPKNIISAGDHKTVKKPS